MTQRVIGLMSGTSVDGIDAVLVDISGYKADLTIALVAAATYPYPDALRSQILAVAGGAAITLPALAALDDAIAIAFAQAALAIQANHSPAQLIGSHGQTVFHRPPQWGRDLADDRASEPASEPVTALGYSLQLGRGAVIARHTQIPTVSNFRAADLAAGGQGAPLVPPVDACLLGDPKRDRCVQNIGGIGNVTFLPAQAQVNRSSSVLGWDTGPGNVLIDLAVERFSNGQQTFDRDGAWAAQGKPSQAVVAQWLEQAFFRQSPPKSTGRELFDQAYLDRCLADMAGWSQSDQLATLTELTAASIADSYRRFLPALPAEVLVCGGGSRNSYLMQRIQANLDAVWVGTTTDRGLDAEFKEAIAFAVLAYWRCLEIPGNLPEVTGARQSALLGEVHQVL